MRRAWISLTTLGLMTALAHPGLADTWQPRSPWRIDGGRVAPWAAPGTPVDATYRGRVVRFETTRMAAASPLDCEDATYEWRFIGPEGVFEGHLPVPRAEAARRLGLATASIPTLRVTCANHGFDFHRTRDGALLLALDNVVWTLRPAGRATTPADVAQELLVTHFTHDMGFTPGSVAAKRAFLSSGLRARIARYFARPQPADDAPAINGDPFTDTQEYPDRFTLGATRTDGARTIVPVHFADAAMTRRVDYVFVREGTRWVVDDLLDERGQSLRQLLGESD